MGKVITVDPREFTALRDAMTYATDGKVSQAAFDQVILGHHFPGESREQLTGRARALRRMEPSFLRLSGDEYVLPTNDKLPAPNGRPPPNIKAEMLERLKAHEANHPGHRDYDRTFLTTDPSSPAAPAPAPASHDNGASPSDNSGGLPVAEAQPATPASLPPVPEPEPEVMNSEPALEPAPPAPPSDNGNEPPVEEEQAAPTSPPAEKPGSSSARLTTDELIRRFEETIALQVAIEDAIGTSLHKHVSHAVWVIGRSPQSVETLRRLVINNGGMISNGVKGPAGASYATSPAMREALQKAGVVCVWSNQRIDAFLAKHSLERKVQLPQPPPPAPPATPPSAPEVSQSEEEPEAVMEELSVRVLCELNLLQEIGGRALTSAENLLIFRRYYPENQVHVARNQHVRKGRIQKTGADEAARYLALPAPKTFIRAKVMNQVRLDKVAELDRAQAEALLKGLNSDTPPAPASPATPLVPPPPADVIEETALVETGELSRRILEDLALTEKEKGDKLDNDQSLAVIIRYTGDRKSAQQTRAHLVQSRLLKALWTSAKDGRARWYAASTGPFSQIRHFKKDIGLLERVKPLSPAEARAIVGKTAEPPLASVPQASAPTTVPSTPPVAAPAPPAIKPDHSELIARLTDSAEHADQQAATCHQRLVALREAREAIVATLAEADRAISDEEARLTRCQADAAATREAIAALTS